MKQIFPFISALNWPSNVPHAWLALHQFGIQEQQFRFVPEIGHFAAPEVIEEEEREDPEPDSDILSKRHPFSPKFFRETDPQPRYGAKVNYVDPAEVFPRMKVNVRAETRTHFDYDAEGNAIPKFDEVVGRLAHFFPPMMAGLKGTYDPEAPPELRSGEKPVAMLTRQVCAAYPELMRTIPPDARNTLLAVSEWLEKALLADNANVQENWVRQAAEVPGFLTDLPACYGAWVEVADKIAVTEEDGLSAQEIARRTDYVSALGRRPVSRLSRRPQNRTSRRRDHQCTEQSGAGQPPPSAYPADETGGGAGRGISSGAGAYRPRNDGNYDDAGFRGRRRD